MPDVFSKITAKVRGLTREDTARGTKQEHYVYPKREDGLSIATYPSPLSNRQPGPGRLPPRVRNTHYHDKMKFLNPSGRPHQTLRDLGFSGVLDGKVIWVWGDTLMGTCEEDARICAVDSTSVSHDLSNPMVLTDTHMTYNTENVGNFIPCTAEEEANGGLSCYAFGGTNIIEVEPGVGICYYLKIHRPQGVQSIKGAGVATVRLQQPGDIPVAERVGEKLWDEHDIAVGDVGVQLDPRDGMVYLFSHGPQGDEELYTRTFLCRCPKDRYADVASYEYWLNNERRWVRERLKSHSQSNTIKLQKEHAIWDWHAMGQSNPFWSNHFNCWLWLHASAFPSCDIQCHTAANLEGPWKDHGTLVVHEKQRAEPEGGLGMNGGMSYCVTGHPEFDESGKTVLVTWTRNNFIWGATLEFE